MLSALPDCSESRLARKEEPQLMTHPNRLPTTLEENGTTAKSTRSQRYRKIQKLQTLQKVRLVIIVCVSMLIS
jgi:hypothetical protein